MATVGDDRDYGMMTAAISAGVRIGNWTILNVSGHRASASCVCGAVRILAVAALVDGSVSPDTRGNGLMQHTLAHKFSTPSWTKPRKSWAATLHLYPGEEALDQPAFM
jgi:hypothetical protein